MMTGRAIESMHRLPGSSPATTMVPPIKAQNRTGLGVRKMKIIVHYCKKKIIFAGSFE